MQPEDRAQLLRLDRSALFALRAYLLHLMNPRSWQPTLEAEADWEDAERKRSRKFQVFPPYTGPVRMIGDRRQVITLGSQDLRRSSDRPDDYPRYVGRSE